MSLDLRTRIVLIDDHPLVRVGLRQLLTAETDLTVIGEAGGATEALALCRDLDPDVAVVDLMLQDGNGLELIKALAEALPHVAILVLSMHDPRTYAERCRRAGARGYLAKDEAAERIVSAIRTIAAGSAWDAGGATGHPVSGLSDRELHVFELIGEGQPTRAIAARLGLSDKTVEAHKANIKRKLAVDSAAALGRLAIAWRESGGRGGQLVS